MWLRLENIPAKKKLILIPTDTACLGREKIAPPEGVLTGEMPQKERVAMQIVQMNLDVKLFQHLFCVMIVYSARTQTTQKAQMNAEEPRIFTDETDGHG